MKIGFGLVTCQRNPGDPEGRDHATLYRQAIELAKGVEAVGLDSYWVSEHHFWDDGHLPSLLALLAAVATVTERIELATGVLLAPLHDPVRLAEDAAVVDLISNGRLILGLGLGWRGEEFAGFGTTRRERVPRLEETIATLRAAWAPDAAVGAENVIVTPKPARVGGPPIMLGGLVDKAVERALRLADGFLAVVPPWTDEVLAGHAEKIRAAPKSIELSAHVDVFIWDGPEDPWDVVRDYRWYSDWKYEDAEGPHGDRHNRTPADAPPAPEQYRHVGERVVGRPEQVLERLREVGKHLTPGGHLVAKAYYPGLPWEAQLRQVRLLGELAKELADPDHERVPARGG
jgi:alkanesulfonate monooxygenase SsuD/methylene tetrahydromethanopterin reductase-like flavin-dependent oxidoreductase (luciferase family)